MWDSLHIMLFNKEVCCVVILFNPDLAKIKRDFCRYKAINIKSIFIDNNSINKDEIKKLNIDVIFFDENKGTAKAHNVGIDIAKKLGFKYVLLLDQDTELEGDFFKKIYNSFKYIKNNIDSQVIALGPMHQDNDDGFFYDLILPDSSIMNPLLCEGPYIEVIGIISSGSFIDIDKFYEVGYFKENYFIDYTDIEWGYRARGVRYSSYVDKGNIVKHKIGEKIIINGKNKNIHSSFRRYYMVRNSFYLLFEKHVPFKYSFNNLYNQIIHSFYLICFLKGERFDYAYSTVRGIFHGVMYKFLGFILR